VFGPLLLLAEAAATAAILHNSINNAHTDTD
jgi:hypothetical protein